MDIWEDSGASGPSRPETLATPCGVKCNCSSVAWGRLPFKPLCSVLLFLLFSMEIQLCSWTGRFIGNPQGSIFSGSCCLRRQGNHAFGVSLGGQSPPSHVRGHRKRVPEPEMIRWSVAAAQGPGQISRGLSRWSMLPWGRRAKGEDTAEVQGVKFGSQIENHSPCLLFAHLTSRHVKGARVIGQQGGRLPCTQPTWVRSSAFHVCP